MTVYNTNEATNPYSNCLSLKTQMIGDKNVSINYLQTLEESCWLILFEII